MSTTIPEPRLAPPDWQPTDGGGLGVGAARVLILLNVGLAAFYLSWLLAPGRAAQPVLYALLVGAELFNLAQGFGFWWTVSRAGKGRDHPPAAIPADVDVIVPTLNEGLDVVEPTLAAVVALPRTGGSVVLFDDGGRDEMEDLARRYGTRYMTRPTREGAKAGAINYALQRCDAPFVAVLDCDHVPDERFLAACLERFDSPQVAFVQAPQYYANWRDGGVAEASWAQQSLFFGPIARGRDALGAMFCCGTNVVFRRSALDAVGGFSSDSLTEDFELSIRLHERGWESRYVPEVLASGLGPEDIGAYVGQQLRWARGCLSSLPLIVRSRLALRQRLQYLLSAAYWLTGWTLLVYMLFPVVRIVSGRYQPVQVASAEEFLVHWLPYFTVSMATVALVGRGRYTYGAFALMSSSFWIHVLATLLTLGRRKGTFAVTPKRARAGRQIRPVLVPGLTALALAGVALYGVLVTPGPAGVTNASFAMVHVVVLLGGVRHGLRRPVVAEAAPVDRGVV